MNFLVNKHVHAEPKKTNKNNSRKQWGANRYKKNLKVKTPQEYSEIDTCKLLKKKYWIWQTIYLLNQLLGHTVIKYNDNNVHHKETQ